MAERETLTLRGVTVRYRPPKARAPMAVNPGSVGSPAKRRRLTLGDAGARRAAPTADSPTVRPATGQVTTKPTAGSAAVVATRDPTVEATATPPQPARSSKLKKMVAQLHQALAQRSPMLFVRPLQPMKVGIRKDIVAQRPAGVTVAAVTRYLSLHVKKLAYQKALAWGGPRYDLDGQVVGEVTERQRKLARKWVDQWREREQRRAGKAVEGA